MELFPKDFPDLLAELVSPVDVDEPAKSSPLTWQCRHSHPTWQARFFNRAVLGTGCPYCSGRNAIPGENDLVTRRPDLAKQFDIEKNHPLRPENLKESSGKKVWWNCRKGHPSWEAIVANRTKGKGCPYCSGRKAVPGVNDLATLHPRISREWDSEKNENPDPTGISPNANKKYWWRCALSHSWEAPPVSRVSMKSGCPYCANQKVLAGWNDLASLGEPFVSEYALSNPRPIQEVYQRAKYKVTWVCQEAHKQWDTVVRNRTVLGTGCPTCAGRFEKGVNSLDCLSLDFLHEWNEELNSPLTIRDVGLSQEVWWKCSVDDSHVWRTSAYSRTWGRGTCPDCRQGGGFRQSLPGIFYLLRNETLNARKAGITNQGIKTDRIKKWVDLGWDVVQLWVHEDGQITRDLETAFFRWVRLDLGLPPYLSIDEMTRAGWKETFSADGPSDIDLIARIDELDKSLEVASDTVLETA